ncbi:MAG: tetratricopeptide repeat protein [Spirochaetaceae bacterium]|jgi:tetratricopeptide (TPR) repeat protein|nr:tetratricopeptide repeat protein [Spirochaetaceae bacterium]
MVKKSSIPLLLFCLFMLAGCEVIRTQLATFAVLKSPDTTTVPVSRYYLTGSTVQKAALYDLFTLLDKEKEAGPLQFAVVREIATSYLQQKAYGPLVTFLHARINAQPEDNYNAYYLLMIAYSWTEQDAQAVAALYFDIILKNYPDLIVSGQSIHLACLNQLISLVKEPARLVKYYRELIERFSNDIDLGLAYFMLAQAYEQTGEWSSAVETYAQYLSFSDTIIPGFPNADHYAKQLVDFNNSSKDWTFDNVGTLVATIKAALDSGNATRLWQYRAKVNFFARSWAQENTDDSGMADFNLTEFMRGNRIYYNSTLDAGSNASEVYLRTWGWAQYSVWYLCFRKIYFPSDPEIHGRWEWSGVYYGEKF